MKQEYIAQGKTIDEAIDEAATQLGIDRDELSIEILETPSKGFLGFGSSPAKIKASYGTDELPAEQQAREYLEQLCEIMDLKDVQIQIDVSGKNMRINMTGPHLGTLIGKRGETMYAVQYLLSLAINKNDGQYMHVELDIEDYRKKRTAALEKLAQRMAEKVVKTKRNTSLEYMQAYERRIIHSTVCNDKIRRRGTVPQSDYFLSPQGGRRGKLQTLNPKKYNSPKLRFGLFFYSTLCLASPHMRHAGNHAVAAQRLRKRCPSRVRHRHTHRLSRSTGIDPPWASPRHRRIPALGFSPAQSSCSAGRTRAELDTAMRPVPAQQVRSDFSGSASAGHGKHLLHNPF